MKEIWKKHGYEFYIEPLAIHKDFNSTNMMQMLMDEENADVPRVSVLILHQLTIMESVYIRSILMSIFSYMVDPDNIIRASEEFFIE